MEVAEDIELVNAGQDRVEDVDNEQQHSILLGQAPPVDVRGNEEESHSGQQHQTRVGQACNKRDKVDLTRNKPDKVGQAWPATNQTKQTWSATNQTKQSRPDLQQT